MCHGVGEERGKGGSLSFREYISLSTLCSVWHIRDLLHSSDCRERYRRGYTEDLMVWTWELFLNPSFIPASKNPHNFKSKAFEVERCHIDTGCRFSVLQYQLLFLHHFITFQKILDSSDLLLFPYLLLLSLNVCVLKNYF